ncbi:hypothetical protein FRAAL4925 [Frankia alni ACN14a]|uniref:Uncharacterized protein n=1 Tax=Frankia alni (strain DSM 45986 / CECT 9034 / ACN14a) TaxID=326424 RepID=Q0RG23_FRAAA|nr:hypothetical protein FRAAL4925 [Frankia alni ACN14a]
MMSCAQVRPASAGVGTFSRLNQGENGARRGEGASQKAQVARAVIETAAERSRYTGNVESFPYACEVSCRVRAGKPGRLRGGDLTPRAAVTGPPGGTWFPRFCPSCLGGTPDRGQNSASARSN